MKKQVSKAIQQIEFKRAVKAFIRYTLMKISQSSQNNPVVETWQEMRERVVFEYSAFTMHSLDMMLMQNCDPEHCTAHPSQDMFLRIADMDGLYVIILYDYVCEDGNVRCIRWEFTEIYEMIQATETILYQYFWIPQSYDIMFSNLLNKASKIE